MIERRKNEVGFNSFSIDIQEPTIIKWATVEMPLYKVKVVSKKK